MSWKKVLMIGAGALLGALLPAALFGMPLGTVLLHTGRLYDGVTLGDFFTLRDLLSPAAWGLGLLADLVIGALWLALGKHTPKLGRLLGGDAKGVDSPLENSRFLTDKERDKYFPGFDFAEAASSGKDGVPVRAVLDRKGRLQVNLLGGAHSQVIGATSAGSSMVMTDPKGELFSLHSKHLQSRGYHVMVLDLRDTYSSYRWNPLESIWDMYQEYVRLGSRILVHRDAILDYHELKWVGDPDSFGEQWYEWEGKAYSNCRSPLSSAVTLSRQVVSAADSTLSSYWQSALQLLATSADLTQDLRLDVYNEQAAYAVQTVSREVSTYSGFSALQSASPPPNTGIDTATTIFLIATMEAANNSAYNGGEFTDALRIGYVEGKKDYMSLKQVERDFDIWEIDYLTAYLACIVFFVIMCICIFNFVVRMFNLILLYLVAPLFASSMPLDEGGKFQSWTQAFVIQLFSGFGSIIAMRLYLIIIPITTSSDLVFFPNSRFLNYMARLLMLLGGAWAVLQASGVITGILAGNPGMAAIQNEGRIGSMVTSFVMQVPRTAMHSATSLVKLTGQAATQIWDGKQRVSGSLSSGNSGPGSQARDAQRTPGQADAAGPQGGGTGGPKTALPGGEARQQRQTGPSDQRAGQGALGAASGPSARTGVRPGEGHRRGVQARRRRGRKRPGAAAVRRGSAPLISGRLILIPGRPSWPSRPGSGWICRDCFSSPRSTTWST